MDFFFTDFIIREPLKMRMTPPIAIECETTPQKVGSATSPAITMIMPTTTNPITSEIHPKKE